MAYRVGDILNGVSVEELEPGTIFKVLEGVKYGLMKLVYEISKY